MATDIGSLAPGMDGHVVGLGIGRKELRKTWGEPRNFIRRTHFSIIDCLAIALL
jgi:hypothetical protein